MRITRAQRSTAYRHGPRRHATNRRSLVPHAMLHTAMRPTRHPALFIQAQYRAARTIFGCLLRIHCYLDFMRIALLPQVGRNSGTHS